jgi:hypothetical protein
MSDIFPKWTNQLPLKILAGLAVTGTAAAAGVWYYCTPKFTRVGYQPMQPVAFSHVTHVDQAGLDCRYCHAGVEQSWYANLPAASTCMRCHNQVLPSDPRLALVRESASTGQTIPWVQVHKTPDYVYFNHAVHVNRGVSCVSCHGQVNQMTEIRHAQPLSMSFCLDCHRHPAPHLRPPGEVYNMEWSMDPIAQAAQGEGYVRHWKIMSSQNCSACHR